MKYTLMRTESVPMEVLHYAPNRYPLLDYQAIGHLKLHNQESATMRIKRSAALVTAPIQLPGEVIRTASQGSNSRLRPQADSVLTQVKQSVALVAENIKKGGDDAIHYTRRQQQRITQAG